MVCTGQLPHTIVQDYLGEPIEGEDVVEFRLLYSGRVLGSSKTDSRASLKHEIRRIFHPQLRRLWHTNNNLLGIQQMIGRNHDLDQMHKNFDGTKASQRILDAKLRDHNRKVGSENNAFVSHGMELLANEWSRCGYRFIPLVTDKFSLRCSLDILFLRPEEPGLLIRSGDIDNRIKTVFDALRMPDTLSEAGGVGPQTGEDPFFCLMENDKLISEVRVTTDQLLLLPQEKELKANGAFLVISVSIKPTELSTGGLRFVP